MAQQLIYTSAARLLDAGRSGFGTVARSKTISPLLVSAIERVSQFSNIRGTERSRVIFVHRRMVAGSNRFHILSRIADAGADYTGRTNHIAHHLIVTQEEMARAASVGITPADVLIQFPWLSRWEGNARFLTPEEDVNLATFQPLGRQSGSSVWAVMTGNPSHARLLAWDGAPRNGILLIPVHADPLALLAEGLAELGSQSWSKAFTTSLETTDELSELDWIIATPATDPEIHRRCGNRATLDLTQPQSLPVPPEPLPEQRKTPPPDHTTRTEPNTTANTPKPNIQHVQTGAGRVRVGGSAGEQRRQTSPNPAARPKQTVQIIAASAVAVMALVILGIVILKFISPKTDEDKTTADTSSLSRIQEEALRDLKQAGIDEEDAKKIVTSVKDDSSEWVDYIKGITSAVKDSNSTVDPQLPKLPADKEPAGSPDWLTSLVEARKQWADLLGKPAESPDFAQKIDDIGNIAMALKVYADATKSGTGKMQLAENDIGTFEKTQTIREFNKLLGAEQAAPLQGAKDQLMKAISSGKFDCLKFPKRYEGLVEMIRERFVTIKSPELLDALKGSVANPKPEDLKGFEQALNLWDKPGQAAGEEINKSRFVPEGYDQLRQAHHKSTPASLTKTDGGGDPNKTDSRGPQPPPNQSEPDLTGVKQKQIIIVSKDGLKNGVKVELLSKLLQDYSKKELIINDLSIEIDGNKKNPEDYKYKVKDQNYYSNAVMPASVKNDGLKIFEDGRIVLPVIDKNAIICFKSNESEFNAYILVDRKENNFFESKSSFNIRINEEHKDTKAALIGGIVELINLVDFKNSNELLWKFDGQTENEIKARGIRFDKKEHVFYRDKQNTPIVSLSQDHRNNIITKFKQLEKSSPGEDEKKSRQELKLTISNTFATTVNGMDEINNVKTFNDFIKKYKESSDFNKKFNYTYPGEKNNELIDRAKCVEVLKREVGEHEFKHFYEKLLNKYASDKKTKLLLSGINHSEFIDDSPVSQIEKIVSLILLETKPASAVQIFADVLNAHIKEVTVETKNGLKLFKASRQP
jgi:hypothetical protein